MYTSALTMIQAQAYFLLEQADEEKFINLYFSDGFDLDYYYVETSCSLLKQAIRYCRLGVVKFMLKNGVKVSQDLLNFTELNVRMRNNRASKFLAQAIHDLIKNEVLKCEK